MINWSSNVACFSWLTELPSATWNANLRLKRDETQTCFPGSWCEKQLAVKADSPSVGHFSQFWLCPSPSDPLALNPMICVWATPSPSSLAFLFTSNDFYNDGLVILCLLFSWTLFSGYFATAWDEEYIDTYLLAESKWVGFWTTGGAVLVRLLIIDITLSSNVTALKDHISFSNSV